MAQQESSIEVKVGALVLVSLVLFVGFVLALGDFSLSEGFQVEVDFENAAGLKPGADVALAGIQVGTVDNIEFRPRDGENDMEGVDVRATLQINREHADTIRSDSDIFVSRQGVLGEPYVEIETNSFDSPPVEDGHVFQGTDLPRVDVIVSKATKLLDTLYEMLDGSDVEAQQFVASAASLFANLDETVAANRDEIDGTMRGARSSAEEASQLLAALNTAVDDGQDLAKLLEDAGATATNARNITGTVDRDIEPMVEDARAAMGSARSVSKSADRLVSDNEDKLDRSIDNVHETTENIERASSDAESVVAAIESGEGTVGQLLSDRELYDDMKELLRNVKRRPWKLIWKD